MRILVVSDLHGNSSAGNNLEKLLNNKYDLLLILGDLTHFGPLSQAEEVLDTLSEYGMKVLAIPGNCDPKSIRDVLEEKGINLHLKAIEFRELTFVGLGGSNITPFNTLFEQTEKEIYKKLSNLTDKVRNDCILATHVPPYGTKADLTSDGIHVGSKSLRKIIEEKQPLVNFCGHVHEAQGIDEIGKTKIVNTGPINRGCAVEADINRDSKFNLLEI